MSTLRDPPRLRQGAGGGGGDEGLARALDAAHGRLPDAQRMGAMERALLAKLTPPPSPRGGGGGGAAGPATMAARWGLGLAAAVGAVAFIAWTAHRAESHKEASLTPSMTLSATASESPRGVPSASSDEEGGPPTVSVESLPMAPAAPGAPRPPPSAAQSSASDSSETELAFLQRAQDALGSHPDQTLALCAEHPRRYPRGVLGEEREVLAIDALMRLGQRGAAEERARRFLASYPTSAHKRRIEQLLGAD